MKKWSLFFLLFFAACSNTNLPYYSALGDLRVLALVVNTPEIQNPSAGTTNVTLTPYLSDINGSGSLTLEVQSCLDPGVSIGATPSCTNASYASAVQTITVTATTGQAAGVFGSPERTGAPSSGAITVGLTIPANLLSAYSSAAQNNGVAYLITMKVTSASSSVSSYKRVLLSTKTPNTNPVLTDLKAGGSSLTSLPSGDVELSFSTSSTAETYVQMSTDGTSQTVTESFETTWFVSDGTVANPRTLSTETTTWSPPSSAPSGRKTVVVGVLRDGRGGSSVLVRTF